MSKRAGNEKASPDREIKKRRTDSTHGDSSVDPESQDARAGAMVEDTSVDRESTDTPDTLTLAKLDRENQGICEAEYSYGEEADLHRHYDTCTKNPGHKNFIPVDTFSIEYLPEGYRDKDKIDYIRAVSDLTVRVTSKYVSDKRPEIDYASGKPFPHYVYRGQWRTTVGTGFVQGVRFSNAYDHEICRCRDCLTSSEPQTEYGIIDIHTAGHVVYDESEAAHTTCHLFFDRGGTPETCEGVVALSGMSHDWGNTNIDECWISHYTHDLDLAHRIRQRCKQRNDLQIRFREKSPHICNLKRSRPARDKQPLLFIVSHPHGCSKQISIGLCHSVYGQPYMQCGYTYTTATCPGSSGAAVNILHKCVQRYWEDRVSGFQTVHHGVCDKQPGMNLSLHSSGVYVHMQCVPLELLLPYREGAPWEDICCAEEEDLRKHYDTCQRNPGHQNFFPVDKVSVDHLPPCECKDDIMKLIKVLSDLTVRVSVRYVSEKRPETVKGTNIPYPWYSYRGSNQLRVGNGGITDVEFPKVGDCECEECKNSGTQTAKEFAYIHIRTVSHLVYEKLEGKQTTCHLFFDSGETPDACKCVVTLTKACHTESDIDEDTCTLVYCTHDLDLAHKLQEFVRLYKNLKRQCHRSYYLEIVKPSERNNLSPTMPLNIVVSHPHGLAKHVSISYPGCHGNTDTEEIQSRYKSITCPGSSGASFIELSPQILYPCFE